MLELKLINVSKRGTDPFPCDFPTSHGMIFIIFETDPEVCFLDMRLFVYISNHADPRIQNANQQRLNSLKTWFSSIPNEVTNGICYS